VNLLSDISYADAYQRLNSDILSPVFSRLEAGQKGDVAYEGGADDCDDCDVSSNSCNDDRLSVGGIHGIVDGEVFPDLCPKSDGNG
jgi:hypothetical protein